MNVTISLDDNLYFLARHKAVDEKRSLSAWIADIIKQQLGISDDKQKLTKAQSKVLALAKKGLNLGGGPYNREKLHKRNKK